MTRRVGNLRVTAPPPSPPRDGADSHGDEALQSPSPTTSAPNSSNALARSAQLLASQQRPKSSGRSKHVPQRHPPASKNLRWTAMAIVAELTRSKDRASHDLAEEVAQAASLDAKYRFPHRDPLPVERNTRRRVYDALKVMVAAGSLLKDGKYLRWIGVDHLQMPALSQRKPCNPVMTVDGHSTATSENNSSGERNPPKDDPAPVEEVTDPDEEEDDSHHEDALSTKRILQLKRLPGEEAAAIRLKMCSCRKRVGEKKAQLVELSAAVAAHEALLKRRKHTAESRVHTPKRQRPDSRIPFPTAFVRGGPGDKPQVEFNKDRSVTCITAKKPIKILTETDIVVLMAEKRELACKRPRVSAKSKSQHMPLVAEVSETVAEHVREEEVGFQKKLKVDGLNKLIKSDTCTASELCPHSETRKRKSKSRTRPLPSSEKKRTAQMTREGRSAKRQRTEPTNSQVHRTEVTGLPQHKSGPETHPQSECSSKQAEASLKLAIVNSNENIFDDRDSSKLTGKDTAMESSGETHHDPQSLSRLVNDDDVPELGLVGETELGMLLRPEDLENILIRPATPVPMESGSPISKKSDDVLLGWVEFDLPVSGTDNT